LRDAIMQHQRFAHAFRACPLIAILRGITPSEAALHGQALYDAGFRIIEVPLNSPDPLSSIKSMRQALPSEVVVGAGTVLTAEEVVHVQQVGAELIVMPHSDAVVISRARELGLASAPGVATPHEAFAALKLGVDALKMFPFEQLGEQVLKAWRAVIPTQISLIPVGGVGVSNLAALMAAGASGFGLGSALYRPGQALATTTVNARAFISAWRTTLPMGSMGHSPND
jgi:2-dehydro-3-deoxyphosphogalactonate aldolase